MSIRTSIRALPRPVFCAMLIAGAAAQAQTHASRVTDVGPPPAEERDSTGAVVLDHSMVRAQRDRAFAASAARTGVASVGRGVLRATSRAQAQAELASARAAEAAEFRRRGAGALTEQ